jgi:hypothetical protein
VRDSEPYNIWVIERYFHLGEDAWVNLSRREKSILAEFNKGLFEIREVSDGLRKQKRLLLKRLEKDGNN